MSRYALGRIASVSRSSRLGIGVLAGTAARGGRPARRSRGMLIYNVLVALFLAYLGAVAHMEGVLLWPGVALHAVVAVLLVLTFRNSATVAADNK